jgi:hypothetical protein
VVVLEKGSNACKIQPSLALVRHHQRRHIRSNWLRRLLTFVNRDMTVSVLDYYEIMPEFLPSDLQQLAVYVRPGELGAYTDPEQWKLVGRTFHPNRLHAADVERQGYCVRKLPAGIDVKGLASRLYGSGPATTA